MRGMFFRLFFFIVALFTSAAAQSQEIFKMGFEVQVANINFVNEHNIIDLRHLRLLTIKQSGREIAHIEIDGSSRNIEFVTQPFDVKDKTKIAELVGLFRFFVDQVLKNGKKLQTLSRTNSFTRINGSNLNEFFPPKFQITLGNSKIEKESQRINQKLKEGFQLEITNSIKDLNRVTIIPQATYQVPLKHVPSLFDKIDEIKNINRSIWKNIDIANLTSEEKGFLFLVHYYLNSLNATFKLAQSQGQAYWAQQMETGIKQEFSVMSRLSFSDIYDHMTKTKALEVALLGADVKKHHFPDYPVVRISVPELNIKFFTIKATELAAFSHEYWKKDYLEGIFTPAEWIKSIISTSGRLRYLSDGTTGEISHKAVRLKKEITPLITLSNQAATHLDAIRRISDEINNRFGEVAGEAQEIERESEDFIAKKIAESKAAKKENSKSLGIKVSLTPPSFSKLEGLINALKEELHKADEGLKQAKEQFDSGESAGHIADALEKGVKPIFMRVLLNQYIQKNADLSKKLESLIQLLEKFTKLEGKSEEFKQQLARYSDLVKGLDFDAHIKLSEEVLFAQQKGSAALEKYNRSLGNNVFIQLNKLFKFADSERDLLYPVPFKNMKDSMGGFGWDESYKDHAVLEIRENGKAFNEKCKRGDLGGGNVFEKLDKFLSSQREKVFSLSRK